MEFRGPTDIQSMVRAIAIGLVVRCPDTSDPTLYMSRSRSTGYPFDDTTPTPEQIERLRTIGYKPVPATSESNGA